MRKGLRNYAWIEANRRKVDELTGGRVAYVYLPDTYAGGYTNFNRYFFAQVDKDAAIIDERHNGGGDVADYVIDYLRRPLLSHWNMREGKDITTPIEAIFGPKVMITNEMPVPEGMLCRGCSAGPASVRCSASARGAVLSVTTQILETFWTVASRARPTWPSIIPTAPGRGESRCSARHRRGI
jgi:hypothetical protein